MSEIRVTTLKDTSGGNSSSTADIYSGRAKAWVNFNGSGSVAIRANFNVNSITDNATGDYTVNFSNALTDGNYACLSWLTKDNELNDEVVFMRTTPNSTRTSSAMRLYSSYGRGPAGNFDSPTIEVHFCR
jgi:hypothetical protein